MSSGSAAQVGVAFLDLHGDGSAAFATFKHPTIEKRFEARRMDFSTSVHGGLASVEEGLRNQRLMLPFVKFSVVSEHAYIERVP
jgi:hypothetical protein